MMAGLFSFTNIVLVIFGGYLALVGSQIYGLFNPLACNLSTDSVNRNCFFPLLKRNASLQLKVAISTSRTSNSLTTIWHVKELFMNTTLDHEVNVTLPQSTVQNGSLYAHVFLGERGNTKLSHFARASVALTKYAVRRRTTVSLLNAAAAAVNSTGNASVDGGNVSVAIEPPITHWKPLLSLHVADTDMVFSREFFPGDINHLFRWVGSQYLPILYVNDMSTRHKELVPIESNSTEMLLKLHFSPYMLGRVRVWAAFAKSFETLQQLGFTDKDMDEVKELFRIQLHFLALTFFVSFVHILFDFLAFKNDISYWRAKKSMAGLSRNVVLYRCFSQVVIFLYLIDENTSLLVTVPNGIACFIELWKVTKALKVSVQWRGFTCLPALQFGAMSSVEAETQGFDAQAFRYLSYAMYPLIAGGAVYSLLYLQYTSWWSWIVHCAANGIYAFGFLMMLPQLFVNYKLKSVAHLPWRVFTYKAFNTFIDDIFAFIITMPTAHRIAVFRDDLVFVVYLYQRWLYPVDMKRANEFGVSYDDDGQGVVSAGAPGADAASKTTSENTATTSVSTKDTSTSSISTKDKLKAE